MRDLKQISRLLSLVLRHNPGNLGLTLDAAGYAPVDELLLALDQRGLPLNRSELDALVSENDKQRFAFSDDGSKIRASQGYSVDIDLGYSPAEPPAILYHGTARRSLVSINKQGLTKQTRRHVHLSGDRETAMTVGARHGASVLLVIDAKQMQLDGYPFYRSANGVWLVAHVPPQYFLVAG